MSEVANKRPARFGGPKQTPAEKRLAQVRAAAAVAQPKARRGETEEQEGSTPPRTRGVAVPHQVEQSAAEPARVVEPPLEVITLGTEVNEFLKYVPPREDSTDLERLAHAQRGIVNAGIAVEGGLGALERDYVLTAGRHLDDVTRSKSYKAAGHKSVEAFAATLGLSRKDVYRLRDAVLVYGDIADLVTKPLSERIIRELAIAHRESGTCREVYLEAERTGRLSSTGVVAARRLLVAGGLSEIVEAEPEDKPDVPAVERLTRAFKAGKLADIEVVKEAAKNNPEVVQAYADSLKAQYNAAIDALTS